MPHLTARVKALADAVMAAPVPEPKPEKELFIERVRLRDVMTQVTPERNRLPEAFDQVMDDLRRINVIETGEAYLITNPKKQVVGMVVPGDHRWRVLGRNIAIDVAEEGMRLRNCRNGLLEFGPSNYVTLEAYGPQKSGMLALDFSKKTDTERKLDLEAEGTVQATVSDRTRMEIQAGKPYYSNAPGPVRFTLRASDAMIRKADIADDAEVKRLNFKSENGEIAVCMRAATRFRRVAVTNAAFHTELAGECKRIPLFEGGSMVSASENQRLQKDAPLPPVKVLESLSR